jgi:hypothetical protein
MRKLLLGVVASCALVVFVPASAVAKRHHQRSHSHHARVHHRTFGSDLSTTSGSTGSGTTSSGQTAGTVQSFTGGVLTILLSDGKTMVSGQVTPDTEITCDAPQSSTGMSHDGGQGNSAGGDHGGNNGNNDDNDQDDNNQGQGDDENANQSSCDSSALAPQAVVQEAELNLSGAGAVWKKVELVSQSSSSSSPSSPSSGD